MARGRHYRIERRLDTRRLKPANIVVVALAATLVISGVTFFYLSKTSGNPVVDISDNRPIAGQVQSATSNYIVHEEPEYKVSLPADWAEKERRDDSYYDYVVYESTGEATTGRSLTIYRNQNRDIPAVTRILPITVLQDKIRPQSISGQCYEFTDLTKTKLDEPAPAKWANVNFSCDPNKILNYIGISSDKDGPGVNLKGRHFEFVFVDHSARPETGIFIEALKSFEAR